MFNLFKKLIESEKGALKIATIVKISQAKHVFHYFFYNFFKHFRA
jgi:hypothetical protein